MVMMGKHFTVQLILIALELKKFQWKSTNLQETKKPYQVFIEYKHKIQQCDDTFALYLLTLC